MMLLPLLLAAAGQAASPSVAGTYRAVTETEYAIELKLEASGRAKLEFRTWEADGSARPQVETFKGTWSWSGRNVRIRLPSGRSLTYAPDVCLSHREFGRTGCSPGLSLIDTTMADRYALKRFALWRTDGLRLQP